MVRSYDDLSENEKRKLETFLVGRSISVRDYNFYLKLGYLIAGFSFVSGLLLAVVGTNILTTGVFSAAIYGENSSTTIGALNGAYKLMQFTPFVVFAGLFGFLIIFALGKYVYERNKKIDYLIFGFDSIKDLCEIKKSDIEDLKKTYKKVKK
jgi:hypothetical protein